MRLPNVELGVKSDLNDRFPSSFRHCTSMVLHLFRTVEHCFQQHWRILQYLRCNTERKVVAREPHSASLHPQFSAQILSFHHIVHSYSNREFFVYWNATCCRTINPQQCINCDHCGLAYHECEIPSPTDLCSRLNTLGACARD